MILRNAIVKSIYEWLLGIRKGFGEEADLLRVAAEADSRIRSTRVIPLVVFIVFALFHTLLCFGSNQVDDGFGASNSFGWMLFRVFVFDYTIFILAAISGLETCRRWRTNTSRVEELSLTPLMPSVMGKSLFVGNLKWWLLICIGFAVVEWLTPLMLFTTAAYELGRLNLPNMMDSALLGLLLISWFVGPIVYAFFHYESAHLAHWMFMQYALPRTKLSNVAILNFLMINIIVLMLSGLGSFLTFLGFMVVMICFGILQGLFGEGFPAEDLFGNYAFWYLASIPSALLIALLKRLITKDFELRFVRAWLMYQWWGAGELQQPGIYPTNFRLALPFWILHFRSQEEILRGVPPHRQRFTPRYKKLVSDVKQKNPIRERKPGDEQV